MYIHYKSQIKFERILGPGFSLVISRLLYFQKRRRGWVVSENLFFVERFLFCDRFWRKKIEVGIELKCAMERRR
ncbi:hypothetical protein CH380_16015 [Leptospira adleri]|uniref:Uncharacterized protein n=1 Tax=Leptospira adleri TaxID=2023186 RepID=A0A2M9YKU3_9LEPT|nr:hypothetical protein CH380_16015 [Leptospira adleri]PJZ63241.1 hypothetical protein CH376_04225 [Leptospira adleri]